MRDRGLLLLILLIILGGIGWFAYRYANRQAFVADEPLPPPPQGEVRFAGPTPPNSFRALEGAVLTRTVFQTDAPAGAHVEVRDYMFPPHAKSGLPALPGVAIFEVYSGEGTLTVGDQAASGGQHLVAGAMRSIPADQSVVVDNQGALSFVVRLYVVEAK